MSDFTELFERAEQAEYQALLLLGRTYFSGTGLEKDLEKAVEYFRRAFELGHEEPVYYLAGL